VPSFGTLIYRNNPKKISENPRNQRIKKQSLYTAIANRQPPPVVSHPL
jgi:hypothetical protein